MAGARIYYVQPDYNKEFDILMPIRADQVKATLEEYPDI
jgi:arginine/lysine/ornithine decarboxylase